MPKTFEDIVDALNDSCADLESIVDEFDDLATAVENPSALADGLRTCSGLASQLISKMEDLKHA